MPVVMHAPRQHPALATRIVTMGTPMPSAGSVCAPSNQYLDLNPFGCAACVAAVCLFWPCAFFVPCIPGLKNNVVYTNGVNTGRVCGP